MGVTEAYERLGAAIVEQACREARDDLRSVSGRYET